ncbi:hypothetical protein RFI_24693 [Reticulomyxa filosa]|uniref:Uncharacterized protein n=1 Tax=Reticulomyxa filosa TaxID=46433 RepID=X6MG71_RETFI|nr:hypothetical protein RFI_24693 [Reticulomyxa filosa]|eukprot:ETO12681.1 hypothetical protein RFI_24693 [Reticulomyxa filosa]
MIFFKKKKRGSEKKNKKKKKKKKKKGPKHSGEDMSSRPYGEVMPQQQPGLTGHRRSVGHIGTTTSRVYMRRSREERKWKGEDNGPLTPSQVTLETSHFHTRDFKSKTTLPPRRMSAHKIKRRTITIRSKAAPRVAAAGVVMPLLEDVSVNPFDLYKTIRISKVVHTHIFV